MAFPPPFTGTWGAYKEELTGWHQRVGAACTSLILLAGGNPVSLSPDPRGCLFEGGEWQGAPLARISWVGGEHQIVGLWPLDRETLLRWRQGCLGPATIDKAASCGGAQPPGPWPPWPPSFPRASVNGAKPQLSPSHSGQCPPQLSCTRHHCPRAAEVRRCTSLCCSTSQR